MYFKFHVFSTILKRILFYSFVDAQYAVQLFIHLFLAFYRTLHSSVYIKFLCYTSSSHYYKISLVSVVSILRRSIDYVGI